MPTDKNNPNKQRGYVGRNPKQVQSVDELPEDEVVEVAEVVALATICKSWRRVKLSLKTFRNPLPILLLSLLSFLYYSSNESLKLQTDSSSNISIEAASVTEQFISGLNGVSISASKPISHLVPCDALDNDCDGDGNIGLSTDKPTVVSTLESRRKATHIDLSQYAGEKIRIGFLINTGNTLGGAIHLEGNDVADTAPDFSSQNLPVAGGYNDQAAAHSQIPNYLDGEPPPWIISAGDVNQQLTTDPGLRLILGETAFSTGCGSNSECAAKVSIEDLEVAVAKPEFARDFDSFDDGLNSWQSSNGIWQVGTPATVQKVYCATNSECINADIDGDSNLDINGNRIDVASVGSGLPRVVDDDNDGVYYIAKVSDGDYPVERVNRLITPTVQLPALSDSGKISLRFNSWFSYASVDSGQIQISAWNPDTSTWNAWTKVGKIDNLYGTTTANTVDIKESIFVDKSINIFSFKDWIILYGISLAIVFILMHILSSPLRDYRGVFINFILRRLTVPP